VLLSQSPRLKPVIRKSIRLFIPVVFFFSPAPAQEIQVPDSIRIRQIDSLRADTQKRFIPSVGNIRQTVDTLSSLHSREFLLTDAVYAGDLLRKIPGNFLREFGSPGQPVQLSRIGTDTRGISLQLDGRPLNDPVTGTYNLYDMPLEFINELESADGSGALFQSPNSSGGTVNFVSHQYNGTRPTTKLRFFQGSFEHILSDGIFAQNIGRGTNAMVGFQRHVTDGRFRNSGYDSWNFRFRLRYNASEDLNMWVSDFYTKSTIGLNGGVDDSKSVSLYDEVTALVRDPGTYQITSRHDLTAGAIGRFFGDTTSLSRATVYVSSIDREYSNGNPLGGSPLFSNMQKSSFTGIKLQQNISFPVGSIDLGGTMESRHVGQDHYFTPRTESYASGSVQTRLTAGRWIEIAFTGRYDRLRGDNGLSWGARLQSRPTPWLDLWVDQSTSSRFPTMQELFWEEPGLSRSDNLRKELHTLSQAGTRLGAGDFKLGVTVFHKKVEDFISLSPWTNGEVGFSFTQTPLLEFNGMTADVNLRFWILELAGAVTLTERKDNGSSAPPIPQFTSVSELSYRNQFVGGELDLKAALRLKAVTRHKGLQFISRLGLFAEQSMSEMPAFSTIDLYIVAKLGDAYLTLEWENPLNVNTVMIPYFPLMDRNIKLGVNWFFTD
jgi:outer membrane cobalamin receptor